MASRIISTRATAASQTAALSRLKKMESPWSDTYTGAVDDLVAAGLVQANQVPGIPGNPKVQATYLGDGTLTRRHRRDDSWLQIRLLKPGIAEVRLPTTEDERQRRHLVQKSRDQQLVEAKCAEARISSMPQTHEAYRAKHAEYAETILRSIQFGAAPNSFHGFCYGDEETEELQHLCSEIVELLKGGSTVFDRRRHHAALTGHRGVIARADGQFVSILESLVESPVNGV